MAKRGFLAEINRQRKLAEQRERQRQAQSARACAQAQREAEKARRAAERAQAEAIRSANAHARRVDRANAQAERARAAELKRAQREAERLHVESRQAEVALRNAKLDEQFAEIDGILAATLDVDDYIDLDSLKTKVKLTAFDAGQLGVAAPRPTKLAAPVQPTYREPALVEPVAGTGIAAAFGGRKKHAAAVDEARAQHQLAVQRARQQYEEAVRNWQAHCRDIDQGHSIAVAKWEADEKQRLVGLDAARDAHDRRFREARAAADERNAEIEEFKNKLAFDVPEAIEEYVALVLSNSVYPESFSVTHSHSFELATRELTITVTVPEPSSLPTVKAYKYVRSSDEIAPTPLTATALKARYSGAVWQTAVRTIHEIFEADRAGKIQLVALTVQTKAVSAATGRPELIPLVQVAADRGAFADLDLSKVVPEETLKHLGASLSKSPYELKPATTNGVRTRSTQ